VASRSLVRYQRETRARDFPNGLISKAPFRRLAVEVLSDRLRVRAGMLDNAIAMIRRCVVRVELHWSRSGIDDVVIRTCGNYNREPGSDFGPNTIKNGLIGALLQAIGQSETGPVRGQTPFSQSDNRSKTNP